MPLTNITTNNKRASVNSSLTVNSNDLRKITKTLGFRVPILTYLKYMKLEEEKKEAIKLAVISLIENSNRIEIRQEQSVTILNMPVNINLVKNENVRSSMDPELTREYVQTLKEELKRAKEIIRRKNEELKHLRSLLDKVRMFASHRDIYSIRKVLGVA